MMGDFESWKEWASHHYYLCDFLLAIPFVVPMFISALSDNKVVILVCLVIAIPALIVRWIISPKIWRASRSDG